MSATGTDQKIEALKEALTDRDPFCSGICPVPEDQLSLYYTQGTDFHVINFVHSTTEELEALSRACRPASFGFNNQDVLDKTYRKAGKMDVDAFSTLFDPRGLRIHEVIEQDLLSTDQTIEVELYKLNIYKKGGFFKAHQDTPRGDNMFGTLVVVFPTPHQGGQLSLRVDDSNHHWIVDFTEQFAQATVPSICFVAFFGDVEHQVLPVASGHRVTLTYNLYFRVQKIPRALPSPFYEHLKKALINLINDPTTLPDGGYLGFGLYHEYTYEESKPIDSLMPNLKGADATLASICAELGLPYTIRLLYVEDHAIWESHFHLLSRVKLTAPRSFCHRGDVYESREDPLLKEAVRNLTTQDLEVVDIIGRPVPRGRRGICDSSDDGSDDGSDRDLAEEDQAYEFLKRFLKDPVPQVLEVMTMYSVSCETPYAYYGNEASTESLYGKACMIISLKPQKSREQITL